MKLLKKVILDNVMAKVIFHPFTRAYARTFEYNRFKQKGLCRLCKNAINFGETIIGTGDRKRKYYHEACAKRVMIISD